MDGSSGAYLVLPSSFRLAAMLFIAVLASLATFLSASDFSASLAASSALLATASVASLAASPTLDDASPSLSAAAEVAEPTASAALEAACFASSLTSVTVVAGTGAGAAGFTGLGVFHGSSTGLDAFQAATPAATAA